MLRAAHPSVDLGVDRRMDLERGGRLNFLRPFSQVTVFKITRR